MKMGEPFYPIGKPQIIPQIYRFSLLFRQILKSVSGAVKSENEILKLAHIIKFKYYYVLKHWEGGLTSCS